jgi:hypothetical protein
MPLLPQNIQAAIMMNHEQDVHDDVQHLGQLGY